MYCDFFQVSRLSFSPIFLSCIYKLVLSLAMNHPLHKVSLTQWNWYTCIWMNVISVFYKRYVLNLVCVK